MSTFRIISIDPGGTTGWATLTADRILPVVPREAVTYKNVEFHSGHLSAPDHHLELFLLLQDQLVETTHVVCESFEYRQESRAGLDLHAPQYIGVVKLFTQQWQLMLYMQTASMGKVVGRKNSFTKKENLVRLGLWKPGKEYKDEMDAYGHLLWHEIHTDRVLRDKLLRKGWR